MEKVAVIIPNWRGRKLLERNLPAVVSASEEAEIIVVDDASPDESNDFLKKNYPQIKLVKHKQNRGFAAAVNSGVEAAGADWVVLLNLDARPKKGYIKACLPHFKNKDVFAVSFAEPGQSWATARFERGFVEHKPGPRTDKTHISFWASGGSAIFDREKWIVFGGMDELYKPFYWEDIDLSYRAWKRGWQVLWEPKAVVEHEHEGIIGQYFSTQYRERVAARNQLFFIWKNITSFRMLAEHKLWLASRLIKPGFWPVYFSAWLKLPQLLPRHLREMKEVTATDEKVFAKFK